MPTVCGQQIKERREMLDMGQAELAAKVGFSHKRNISNYENGDRAPDLEKLCKIADALSCTTDYLLGREKAPTHEAASIIDQTGLPASMIADLQRGKEYIDYLENREKQGLPTDYPFEFDEREKEKRREVYMACARGERSRLLVSFLGILWGESDLEKLAERFFEWESSVAELSKVEQYSPQYHELLDNADLKRYRFIRSIEEFLYDYEQQKTGRDPLEDDF